MYSPTNQMSKILLHLAQPNTTPIFSTSGRIDDSGGRIAKAELLPDATITASTAHSTVTVDLKAIPTQAPWPRSKNHDEICKMLKIERESGAPGPYSHPDIDCETVFFIPSEAIVCKLKKRGGEEESVLCEGYFNSEQNSLRIDAVDQDQYSWFWMSTELAA
jgi:hypothetical protein